LDALPERSGFLLTGYSNGMNVANTVTTRVKVDLTKHKATFVSKDLFDSYMLDGISSPEDLPHGHYLKPVEEIEFPSLISESSLWHSTSQPFDRDSDWIVDLRTSTFAPSDLISNLGLHPYDDQPCDGNQDGIMTTDMDLEAKYVIAGHRYFVFGNVEGARLYSHWFVSSSRHGSIDSCFHILDPTGSRGPFRKRDLLFFSTAVAFAPHPVIAIDAATLKELCCIDGFDSGPDAAGVSVSPDGRLAAIRMDGEIGWGRDSNPGFQVGLFQRQGNRLARSRVLFWDREPVSAVNFLSDHLLAFVVGRQTLVVFDLDSGSLAWSRQSRSGAGLAISGIVTCPSCTVAVVHGKDWLQLLLKSRGLPLSEPINLKRDMRLRGTIKTIRVEQSGSVLLCTDRHECKERDAPDPLEKLAELMARPSRWTAVNASGQDIIDLPR
jgi:hypothetical protein